MKVKATPGLLIGELAARSGRSVHAIRWYESQGLMPGVVRDAGGRRVYDEMHVGWLALMDRLRLTGMSVAEMAEYTALVRQGRRSLAQRRDLLDAHRARVLATIAQWTEALALLDGKLAFYDEWLATGTAPGQPPAPLKAAGSGLAKPPTGRRRRPARGGRSRRAPRR